MPIFLFQQGIGQSKRSLHFISYKESKRLPKTKTVGADLCVCPDTQATVFTADTQIRPTDSMDNLSSDTPS